MIYLLAQKATPQQIRDMLEIYPHLGNRSIVIQSEEIRQAVKAVTLAILGGEE